MIMANAVAKIINQIGANGGKLKAIKIAVKIAEPSNKKNLIDFLRNFRHKNSQHKAVKIANTICHKICDPKR